jgi:23S rRNA pseudouridine1911/1915/1917 synthase
VLGPEEQPERIDKVLARLSPETSRTTIQRWIDEGRVSVDGSPCRRKDLVGAGRVLVVAPGPPPLTEVRPDPRVRFEVVFEDLHLIVVNNPAGVVVHPGRGHWDGTLVAGLIARPGFARPPQDPLDPEGHLRPGVVHRIDKGTSGLLVIAKDEPAREGLKAQLAARTVERAYRAFTIGLPTSGRIESLHGRHPKSKRKFTSFVATGRRAVTNVEVQEWLANAGVAVVVCRLETGRTHQIRVHLSERAQTPILCDPIYGGIPKWEPLRAIAVALQRQALHAEVLGFVHPLTHERLRFEAPLPPDMASALETLRAVTSRR